MPELEYKSIGEFELSDMSKEHKTAVIAHAVYDHIDNAGDIARRGMFSKSWKENKSVDFLIDHDKRQRPGMVIELFDDEKKAYTKVKFGSHTLGTDTMLMMDEGIIKGASFGFYTIKANRLEVKGKKVRELKEVIHDETTVAYSKIPINPRAGVIKVTKAEMGALHEFKSHLERMESFCRNTTASDETILNIEAEIKAAKQIISQYDTADTHLINEPFASRPDNDIRNRVLLLNMQFSQAAQT